MGDPADKLKPTPLPPGASPAPDFVEPPEVKTDPGLRANPIVVTAERHAARAATKAVSDVREEVSAKVKKTGRRSTWKAIGASLATGAAAVWGGSAVHDGSNTKAHGAMDARVTAVEKRVDDLKDEMHRGQDAQQATLQMVLNAQLEQAKDTRELYRVSPVRIRSERLERPPAIPDGGR